MLSGSDVINFDGKSIGKVADDGSVIGPSSTSIGTVDTFGVVRNSTNSVIGFVPSGSNRLYGTNGNLIGSFTADGKITATGGGLIQGSVDKNGVLRNSAGQILGFASRKIVSPYKDQAVLNAQGKSIGQVDENGFIKAANGSNVGYVDALGIARSGNGVIIGFIPATVGSPFGGYEAYATDGQTIGTIDDTGTVRNASGQVVGKAGSDGIVISAAKPVGFVPAIVTSGLAGLKVYDINGNSIAIIADGGSAISRGSQIGKVDAKSLVRDSLGKTVGFVPLTSTAPRTALIGRNVLDGDGASIGTVARDGSVRQGDRTVAGVEVSGVARDTAGIKAGVSATTVKLHGSHHSWQSHSLWRCCGKYDGRHLGPCPRGRHCGSGRISGRHGACLGSGRG